MFFVEGKSNENSIENQKENQDDGMIEEKKPTTNKKDEHNGNKKKNMEENIIKKIFTYRSNGFVCGRRPGEREDRGDDERVRASEEMYVKNAFDGIITPN